MTFREAKDWTTRNSNVLFFIGGFVFDLFTLVRIDSVLDLAYQTVYLGLITFILIKQYRYELKLWEPRGLVARFWHYETEAIHFFYGGLLSAYVIFYFKSTTGPRSMVFLVLTLLLMFANEMPQIKEAGSRMRLGLHAFCTASFLNYLIPILFGRMGAWTFALAILLTALGSSFLVRYLADLLPHDKYGRWSLGWPPALVLTLLVIFYSQKWIPPVPLSMQYGGVYHEIRREGDRFVLKYPKPRWYRFWKKSSSPFEAQPGDTVICFVRVFAPRRFSQQIFMRWSTILNDKKGYEVADRIPLNISGGRGEGFRGYGMKSNFSPGKWRVDVITDDDRVIGQVNFVIVPTEAGAPREWRERWM